MEVLEEMEEDLPTVVMEAMEELFLLMYVETSKGSQNAQLCFIVN